MADNPNKPTDERGRYEARTDDQKLADRAKIAELLLKGWKQAAIARDLNLSVSTVCRDAQDIREEWKATALEDTATLVNKELQELDLLKSELYEAWDRSKLDKSVTTKSGGEGKGSNVSLKRETQEGNPAFLKLLIEISKERRELLGLNAPKKTQMSGPDGGPIPFIDFTDMTDDQLAAYLQTSRPPGTDNA